MSFLKHSPDKEGQKVPAKPKHAVKTRRFEYWLAWLLFLALFFIFITIFGQNGLLEIGELKQVRMVLSEEIVQLQEENDTLRREVAGLKEDPFFIEKVAREELGLVRPNELVYLIPSQTDGERGE